MKSIPLFYYATMSLLRMGLNIEVRAVPYLSTNFQSLLNKLRHLKQVKTGSGAFRAQKAVPPFAGQFLNFFFF